MALDTTHPHNKEHRIIDCTLNLSPFLECVICLLEGPPPTNELSLEIGEGENDDVCFTLRCFCVVCVCDLTLLLDDLIDNHKESRTPPPTTSFQFPPANNVTQLANNYLDRSAIDFCVLPKSYGLDASPIVVVQSRDYPNYQSLRERICSPFFTVLVFFFDNLFPQLFLFFFFSFSFFVCASFGG